MTFKYSGQMRWNDDTQLWNEILQKERVTNKIHKTYNQTQDFANQYDDYKYVVIDKTKNIGKYKNGFHEIYIPQTS